MSDDKTLAEALLRVRRAIGSLSIAEKSAVLDMAGRLVQAEIQAIQMETNAALLRSLNPAPPAVADEHFRQ